jgi:hypothetical protein
MDLAVKEPARNYVIGAWVIAAALLWLVLRFDLLPALLAGLLVFELVHVLTMRLNFVRERRARIVAVAFIAAVVVGLLSLAAFASLLFFRSDTGGYVLLLQKSADVIQSWRGLLPPGSSTRCRPTQRGCKAASCRGSRSTSPPCRRSARKERGS